MVTVRLLASLALLAAAFMARAETTVLHATRVMVEPGAAPIEEGVVVLRDGRILAVGPRADVPLAEGARELDCPRGVVAAGFQNSHVHFQRPLFDVHAARRIELDERMAQMLNRHGFTTVVDTGSDRDNTLALRRMVDSGRLEGPRILTAGAPLFAPHALTAEVAAASRRQVGSMPQPESPEAAVAAVQANLRGGADATKLFLETPQPDGTVQRMPQDIASAAVAATHAAGRMAMAHATDVQGVRVALAAGVDILVHTTMDAGAAWPPPLVQALVEAHVALTPTLKLWHDMLADPKRIEGPLAQLRAFSERGGRVLFGTDVGFLKDSDPTEEYRLMARAGLDAAQILASLTTAPADQWHEADRRGRVRAGLDADLVVLEADPSQDAANFAKVLCTVRAGRVVYRR